MILFWDSKINPKKLCIFIFVFQKTGYGIIDTPLSFHSPSSPERIPTHPTHPSLLRKKSLGKTGVPVRTAALGPAGGSCSTPASPPDDIPEIGEDDINLNTVLISAYSWSMVRSSQVQVRNLF